MRHPLVEMMMLISDHGSVLASKLVNGIGAVSVGSGLTLGAVATSIPQNESFWTSNLPIIAAVVSILGGITFVAKNLFDIWLAWHKKDK